MRLAILCVLLLAACSGSESVVTKAPPAGPWLSATGNVEVVLAPCGDKLCGTVTKVRGNRSMSASGGEAAVPPPAIGTALMTDFVANGGNDWRGHLYNRETGKTYDCQISVIDGDHLLVRPYILLLLFGASQVWQRVEG